MKNPNLLLLLGLGAAAATYVVFASKAAADAGGPHKRHVLTISGADVTKAAKMPGKVVTFYIRVFSFIPGAEELAETPRVKVVVQDADMAFADINENGGVEVIGYVDGDKNESFVNAYPSSVTPKEFASSLQAMFKDYISKVEIV